VTPLVVLSALLLMYAALSRRLERLWISAAMAFMLAGAVLGAAGVGWADGASSETIKLLAEAALAITLFSDAARIDLKHLRAGLRLPSRLLGIGLPLTIIVGALIAVPLLPGLSAAEIALVAIILAPTDAALGQQVVLNKQVPRSIRQALNVESGLNDGIAVPFYLVALDLAKVEATASSTARLIPTAVQQIGIGILCGVVAGALAGWVLKRFGDQDWIETAWRQVVMLVGATLAFGLADALGGSGFIAAFVGGMAFAYVAKDRELGTAYLSEEMSALLSAAIFVFAGAIAYAVLQDADWRVFAYAALSLTVVRMIPVAIACLGTSLKAPSVVFVGWFGPRGLASIVFGLGLLEAALPGQSLLLQTILATVVLSVVAHGLTATPLAAAYGAWNERAERAAEATETHEQRSRLRI
jgi:NhaP-type Na+/H+ or K+/H+ antiporter